MRVPAAAVSGVIALAFLLALLPGCGGGESDVAKPPSMRELARSVEAQSAPFLRRDGTTLRRNLVRFLGGPVETSVAKGSVECRAGRDTPSISDPKKYPFACIVEGSAAGKGLTVNVTLGFVGLKLDDRCWRAANERVSVTTGAPALLSAEEARRPVNQIAACA
jgi:hypothetical protein